jgi:dipeptidyl-peptidase III
LGRIGFRDENGQTSYYSANITSKDAKFVDEFCQSKNISPLNTRLFKLQDGSFELKVCSAVTDSTKELPFLGDHIFKDVRIKVTSGDFSDIMHDVVAHISQALKFVANDNQKQMLESYIEHF